MKIDKSISIFIRDMRNRARVWGHRSSQYTLEEIKDEMNYMANQLERMVKTGKTYDEVIKEETSEG